MRKILLSLKGRISDEKNSQLSTKHFNPAIHKTFQPKHFGQKKKKPSWNKKTHRRRWSSTATLSSRTVAVEAQRRRSELVDCDSQLADHDVQSSPITTLWARRSRLWARRSWRSELADRDAQLTDCDAQSSSIATLLIVGDALARRRRLVRPNV